MSRTRLFQCSPHASLSLRVRHAILIPSRSPFPIFQNLKNSSAARNADCRDLTRLCLCTGVRLCTGVKLRSESSNSKWSLDCVSMRLVRTSLCTPHPLVTGFALFLSPRSNPPLPEGRLDFPKSPRSNPPLPEGRLDFRTSPRSNPQHN